MAVDHTVLYSPTVSQLPRHGTLCLFGFGIRVSVVNGNLSCQDGIGSERSAFLLSKVNSNLKRLVLISSDGFISLEALRWIADREASFYMLDRRGKALAVCGPSAPSDARLRRAQALALGNGTALRISKELIRQKLEGQATLVCDMLQNAAAAYAIEKFRDELPDADSIESVRIIEAQAAKQYWSAWADVPIRWPRKDERRVPDHWKCFGSRISPLTHSPRLAASPANACLNFLYSVLESESTLASSAMGLLPEVGLLHADAPNRNSLSCDLMEVCRPKCDAFVLHWLQSEPLRKSDFWEERNGNCRLVSALAIRLSETAETWRKLVAPVAEYVAQQLWSSISKSASTPARQLIATRLTQSRKRSVKGSHVPLVKAPKPDSVCRGCGKIVTRGKRYCAGCAQTATRENFSAGRAIAQGPESLAKRSDTQRQHKVAIRNWQSSDLPAWLTPDVYARRIQPALATVATARISSTLGVSEPYASGIRAGRRRPHLRHWQALAQLVGLAGCN
jgi:CRISPR-associated endonuclease Cas1